MFVDEDSIQDSVKHYFKFEEELFTQAKRSAAKGVEVKPPTSLSTIVMDSKILSPTEVSACVCMRACKHVCACLCAPPACRHRCARIFLSKHERMGASHAIIGP